MPSIMYGTAWKEDRTKELCTQALSAGFTGFDTANQRKHYNETALGEALKLSGASRDSLFIQTKFTPIGGHDERVPYDPSKPVVDQVSQSFEGSLRNLQVDYLDSYLLHGPYGRPKLIDEDWEVWGKLEEIYESGGAKRIGISNVNYEQLATLWSDSKIKPMVVQNRCFAQDGWDAKVREFCIGNQILYQGFSLLTANPFMLSHPAVDAAAARLEKTPAQVIFRFAIQSGMVPLTGTTNEAHMAQDLASCQFTLTDEDMTLIAELPS